MMIESQRGEPPRTDDLAALDAAVEAGYPRPRLVRDGFVDLSGEWEFRFDDADVGRDERFAQPLAAGPWRSIIVPFPFESERSGIGDPGPHPIVWYRRRITLPTHGAHERVVVHFGAVDYGAQVFLDGALLVEHCGGHTPFSCALPADAHGEVYLVVRAEDQPGDLAQPRGKQDWRDVPHSVWYGRTSGIWQPVWPTLMKIDYAKQTFELTPIYYVYENYTRFIRPGYQFFAADDSSTLAAFDTNDGKLTIMKQNWTDSTTDVRFDLSNFTLEQACVVSYCSFGTEPLRATIPVRVAASGFTGSIPAQSVVTYVISGVSIREPSLKLFAAGPKKTRKAFHFTGRWRSSIGLGGNDEVFSARACNFYTISFVGRHARIYGPLGPMEGIAAFSVDGGGKTDVNLYSGKGRDDAMLFSTPLLASGPHTVSTTVVTK
jgi:hypothetical protein